MVFKIGGSIGKAFEDTKKAVQENPVGTIGGAILGGPLGAAIGGAVEKAVKDATGPGQTGPSAEQQAAAAKAAEEERRFQEQVRGRAGQIQAQQLQTGGLPRSSVNVPGDFRQTQMSLAQQLQAQARGEGPSLAQMQLQQGTDRTLAQQLALAASARTPAQGALARRTAMRQAGEAQQALAGQAAMTRLQEQLASQNALAGLAGTARGQDVQTAGLQTQAQQFNIQQQLQRELANQQAALQAEALKNQALGIATGQQQAAQNVLLGQSQINVQKAAADRAANTQILGGILGAGGAIGSAILSDERVKNSVEPIKSEDLAEFWNAYNAVTFSYNGEEGTYPGFIMQDIENTKLGKDISVDIGDGLKRFDPIKFMGIVAATAKEARHG